MAAFDYRTPAELFPCKSDAGLFPTNGRSLSRQPAGYGRFAHAAYAIRFAIEELPSELLPDACLEVNAELCYSTATEFADCTTAKTIPWFGAQRPLDV
jgi:hypothetical protein